MMAFEKEMIIDELKKSGKTAISNLGKYLQISYYKLKFEIIPEMEKDGIIIISKEDKYTYVEINVRGLNKE